MDHRNLRGGEEEERGGGGGRRPGGEEKDLDEKREERRRPQDEMILGVFASPSLPIVPTCQTHSAYVPTVRA